MFCSKRSAKSVTVAALVLLVVVIAIPTHTIAASSNAVTINQTQSGLVKADSLTSGNLSYWRLYGDAVGENAPYKYSENSSGLQIGVQAATAGTWAGFFAKSQNTTAQLFQAAITLPYTSTPGGYFNTGLYVQTSSGDINFVFCGTSVSTGGYSWRVESATGTHDSATQVTTLWAQDGGPLTQDCTVVTNGSNMLSVYLGSQLVYSSSSLDLQMSEPFNAFLEVESTYSGSMLFGTYADYSATTTGSVTVQDAPPGDIAEITDSSGTVLSSSTVGANGSAVMDVGSYQLPITGNVEVYDSSDALVASTSSAASIYGGDIYTVGSSP
ncbi:MAG: hypothetical protein ACRD6W_17070, partial [Nitrososphaerales archaeon]